MRLSLYNDWSNRVSPEVTSQGLWSAKALPVQLWIHPYSSSTWDTVLFNIGLARYHQTNKKTLFNDQETEESSSSMGSSIMLYFSKSAAHRRNLLQNPRSLYYVLFGIKERLHAAFPSTL